MATQSEADLEKNLINNLVKQGYEKVKINDEKGLKKNLKTQLEKFNNLKLDDNEFNKILIHLENGNIFDKAKKLRDRFSLKNDDGDIKYIRFLDENNWSKNIFQVTNQVTIEKVRRNRYDVTILINGLPLVQIELKKRGLELKRAFKQINRYHRQSYKDLLQYIQIFVISNGVNTKYFANNKPDINFKNTFYWKNKENKNIRCLSDFANIFLDKCHLSKMISKYIVLNETDKELMVLRSYQYYAVESIVDMAVNTKQNGYVWHSTGSGKTLTSFKVSQILSKEKTIDKVIFVIDRNDLDYHTTTEFNKFCKGSVDETENTKSLVKQLLGKRIDRLSEYDNLIITTIQKLNLAVIKDKEDLNDIKDDKIVLIFDECHRSLFGDMHRNITNFFTNSQCFGFTGTPILAENANNTRTTLSIFKNRLHTYVIKDAIQDKNVLPFKMDYIGTSKKSKKPDLDINTDINNNELNMESSNRLEKIVDYIISNHDKKTYDKEFYGMFAVSSRKVLTKYYEIFKSKEHNLKIATIFSLTADEETDPNEDYNDKLEGYIADYNEMFSTNFSTKDIAFYKKDIAKRAKNREIDIFLVDNMFLTGFDSKYLNTLYVDKTLKTHNLIQAYSRTNRTINEKKQHGNIICFRDLKTYTDDAIRMYSDKNALEIVLVEPYENYVEAFNDKLKDLYEDTPDIHDVDDLPSEIEEAKFIKIFRDLLRKYNQLKVFTEFSFDDLDIDEQKFRDYQSKYLDLYEDIMNPIDPNKTSPLEDIDFEIELIRTDLINVAYILNLLQDLDINNPSFSKTKENILEKISGSSHIRNKKDLIEKFIDEELPKINDKDKIDELFNSFLENEKTKALYALINDEKLKKEVIEEIIAEYEYSGKMNRELIRKSFIKPPLYKEKQLKAKIITSKILELEKIYSLNSSLL